MSLRIYNTLSRAVEDFSPLIPGQVRMYVCGMTVYDLCHLGHARAMVAFDVVQRWLKTSGLNVIYVRNVTDIDDKIIRRALENGETIRALTDRMVDALHQDADALGIERPTHEPRATDYVPHMLRLIGRLEEKGLAYQAQSGSSQGDVNYAVRKFPGYGKLSGKSLDELRAGERVDVQDGKDDPLDFVLWKSAKPTEPADAKWDSPYGPGRPGWHIECSAMACELLGESFDIHGGGADLQFPHHENEIAQSEGATLDAATGHGQPLARFWMHNGFVRVDNEKMSKSLGNFFTIREILAKYDAETVRFFILRAHYRSALNYSDAHLDDARASLKRLYTALDTGDALLERTGVVAVAKPIADLSREDGFVESFIDAMNEDFNTPNAISTLFALAGDIGSIRNKAAHSSSEELFILNIKVLAEKVTALRSLGAVLGLLMKQPKIFLQAGAGLDETQIQQRIAERAEAKKAKNFALADSIRKDLLAQGIVLKDSAQGTTWEVQA
jgi:cysteinyl-tRNA synthetase